MKNIYCKIFGRVFYAFLATALFPTLLLAQSLIPDDSRDQGQGDLSRHIITYWDGGHEVQAEYLSPTSDSDGLRRILLTHDEGPSYPARVDAHAILRFRQKMSEEAAHSLFEKMGVVGTELLSPTLGIWHVKSVIEEDGLLLASRLWREHANLIRDAAPDLYLRRQLHSVPNDPEQPGQWYFDKIDMPAAWERSWGSSETTVAVIDNGCDLEHPDLKAKFDQGKDVVSGDDDPSYSLSDSAPEHGTACSGIIAADSNNGLGITGACPECRMRCVRMLGSDTEDSPISADILAFHFAYDTDVDVVSNSWGFIDAVHVPSSLEDVINMVFDDGRGGMGALVIFASGNDNRDIGSYELLAVRGVLGIGAVNIYDQKTSFTNFGDSVDLVAPTGTFTTDISGSGGSDSGDYTNLFGGTSSACPVAAGVAALLVSEAQDKTAQELYDILIETARPAFYADPDENGHDPVYGYGIINPRAALDAVMPPLPKKDDGGCSATGSALFWWMSLGVLGLRRRR